MQDTVSTKDGTNIKLNIQDAIMIKSVENKQEILEVLTEAKKE